MKEARNGLVDYGRFAAALAIVWFHMDVPGTRIAYAALPFFLVLLSMPSTAPLAARAQRLLLPFLIWSAVYAVVHIAFAVKNQAPIFGWWEWHMLLTGTWVHLWFLPFAFLAALLSPWFQHPLASLGAALLAATMFALNGTPQTVPFAQWAFGLIPVLVGIAYFSWGWRLAITTLVGSSLILFLGRPSEDNITILVGTALALVILSNHLPATAVSAWCARLSVWIYLGHPLVIIVGQSLRITWVELGLFSLVGSVILAQLIETGVQASRKGRLAF
ncbi:acyltransferase family protein [Tabrizicola sp.]|uniref:acyltransferase family protein n=1 Tax=Tabrizicola sp. TaxID=2005166 RepID=UPI003F3171D3